MRWILSGMVAGHVYQDGVLFYISYQGWVWWYIAIIPALWRLRQEDLSFRWTRAT
jgi:hypothetical protein